MKRIKKPRPTKLLEKVINEKDAAELLRDSRRRLMRMHTPNGLKWYVVPGGAVSDQTAEKILARPDVHVFDDGLFPGIPQTYRIGH
jgi:hypothetical protein